MRRLWKRFTVPENYQQWLKRNWWWLLICLTALVIAFLAFVLDNWWTRTGFKGKTLWEWLELLGVPLTLAGLGYIFQQQEQKRSRDEAKDEILDVYFDRLSGLLVDQNILTIASKLYPSKNADKDGQVQETLTPEEQELFNAAVDVIRARTLSILRRFQGDSRRKASVIEFLIEAEVLRKARLDLSKSDMSETNLVGANLSETRLSGAILVGTNLVSAYLIRANLTGANLRDAKLIRANLTEANLREANLTRANLREAYLFGANLGSANLSGANLSRIVGGHYSGTNLSRANLSGVNLSGANLSGANLSGANLKDIQYSLETKWPNKEDIAKAKNIPEKLKKELGLMSPEVPKGTESETDSKA